jgi:RNA polymerase sigma-70 factor (ECF subfamily)
MTTASIDEWVIRAQNGAVEAMSILYLNHYQSIYRYLYFRAGDQKTAEDLTSEVFLKMIQALPHYRVQNVPFQAWLFQIARNLAIDYHRKHASHPVIEMQEDLKDGLQSIDETLDIKLTHESLNQAFEKLTDDQRDVILLRFIEGMSLAQVGKTLHKSEDSIKGLQHRALILLRIELSHQEVDHV